MTKKKIKGSELTIQCLERLGTELMFAYPGGFSMELHQALQKSPIRVILPRHEQGGAFAAGGYARATGKVGVCMATSGPGATNLISGIADAYMDSIPTVFITGQVPTHMIGKNVFQETDIIGVTRPIVKHSYLILSAAEIPQVMAEAFHIATSGRPGPVVVDIPKNVQQEMIDADFSGMDNIKLDVYEESIQVKPQESDIERIRAAIAEAKRPCLYVGGGIISAEASKELLQFAESFNIPVTTTLMGIGAFPDRHPLSLKWLGMHGTYYANYAANECDLLLAFGTRFDDRVTGPVATFAAGAKIVHVDIDLTEINKNKVADIGIVANIKDVLTELNKEPLYKDYAEWHAMIRQWKEEHPLTYCKNTETIQPQYVVERLSALTNGKAVIVPGVGQHQMFAAQFYDYSEPRQLLTSGGLGAMGFGLPAAMGAKLACPEKIIVNIDGDGSFQMNIQELGTLHTEDIGVKMIILNNQHLGMVAQWEDRFYGSVRGNTVLGSTRTERPYPDFVTIAKGFMIPGREVYRREDVDAAIEEMLNTDGPFILDVHTGYAEHVLPMIKPGGTYKDMITE
ncbi:MAG: biosynthetic-type acetolactate synthase large subunit [Victivallales bacterium]|nr:biosynthetic-type acetolactate synthase large subunit [Victivallales bacterium]